MKNIIIDVQNIKITVSKEELDDYICITDIAFEIIGAPCAWKYIGRTLTETGSHLTPLLIFTNLIKCAIVTLYLALCVKEC